MKNIVGRGVLWLTRNPGTIPFRIWRSASNDFSLLSSENAWTAISFTSHQSRITSHRAVAFSLRSPNNEH